MYMKSTIEKFYSSFANIDSERMNACYHPDVVFEDPAFGVLKGDRARLMWSMLCASQKDETFEVTYSNIKSDNSTGSAIWEAKYSFGKSGRKVHNIVTAQFEFDGDKIIKHTDDFDLYKWSKQAMGFQGFLFGWTNIFKKQLNLRTNKLLDKFEKIK